MRFNFSGQLKRLTMTRQKRALIEKQLTELREHYQVATDVSTRHVLEQEIAELEAKLREGLQIANTKNTVHQSTVQAGGNLNIGDQVVHHHHYDATAATEVSNLNWKSGLAIIVLCLLLILTLYKCLGKSDSEIASTAVTGQTTPLTIQVRDQNGQVPLRNKGKLILDFEQEVRTAFIDEKGDARVEIPEAYRATGKLQIQVDASGFQAVVKDSSYQLTAPVVVFFVQAQNKNSIKPSDSDPKLKAKKTFAVTSKTAYSAKALRVALEDETDWHFSADQEVKYSIDISHTGNYEQVDGEFYLYPGGYLRIEVNGRACCCEQTVPIDVSGSRTGNRLHTLEKQIKKQIDQILPQHLNHVIEKIKKCTS